MGGGSCCYEGGGMTWVAAYVISAAITWACLCYVGWLTNRFGWPHICFGVVAMIPGPSYIMAVMGLVMVIMETFAYVKRLLRRK